MSTRKQLTRGVRSRHAAVALMATGGLVAGAGLAGLGPIGAQASSHREAPLISGLPQYDTTDVYAFRSPERADTVTLHREEGYSFLVAPALLLLSIALALGERRRRTP